jgi:hypothetical protein
MKTPSIHSNGTSSHVLVDKYMKVLDTTNAAIAALSASAPNGRDYYPQGDNAINEAIKIHEEHMKALVKLNLEAEAVIMAIKDNTPSSSN